MRNKKLLTGIGGSLIILVALAAVVLTTHGRANTQASSVQPGSSVQVNQTAPANQTVQGQTATDAIVHQVLDNMHLHAWNPQAMTKGKTTGGLFINWKMSAPSVTNDTNPGADGNPQHDHDPQTDLLYLTALSEYQQLHPGDTTYQADLNHMTTVVLQDFQHYSLPRGWIYFYLLKDGMMLHQSTIVTEAYNVAKNLYSTWYDPALGTVYDRVHSPGDYDTNDTLQSGSALIDAGMRWHQSDWVSTGEKTLDHTIAVAFNTRYHLFYDSMVIINGKDQVKDYQSRPSTDGEAISALVTAYQLTHRQQYMDIAALVIKSLFTQSGLWDEQNGGLFFAIKLDSGSLNKAYKETRSQTLVLVGLNLYNDVSQQPFTEQEQSLVSVITRHFYQSTYHGFVYRLTPDFHIYVSKPGAGIGVEDYFTTEAMGSAMDALQQTELVVRK